MDSERIEYKGFTIFPTPSLGSGNRWYGGYEILKNGAPVRVRKNIFPGFLYSDAARIDSIEHAKIEIDNLVS